MGISYADSQAVFEGHCAVEEALELADFLRTTEKARVDLSACGSLHTALFQCLMAFGAVVAAPPSDPMLARIVTATLDRDAGAR